MTAYKVRGWVKAATMLGASIAAVNASAMGCGQGNYAMRSMAPPPMGMMAYGMPGGYGYAPPMRYGYGRPMMAHGAHGHVMQVAGQGYRHAAPGDSKPAQASATVTSGGKVNISQMRFEPAVISIEAGETVTWRNGAGIPHTVSGRAASGPESGTLSSGQVFSHTFDEPGTYEYYCALHPSMTGKVVVQ